MCDELHKGLTFIFYKHTSVYLITSKLKQTIHKIQQINNSYKNKLVFLFFFAETAITGTQMQSGSLFTCIIFFTQFLYCFI